MQNAISYVDDFIIGFGNVSIFFFAKSILSSTIRRVQEEMQMIEVTKEAALWFKKELGLQEGEAVRLFARYSAGGQIHPGFSLGIQSDKPVSPGISVMEVGITFFMEEQDKWYLEGYRLKVTYNATEDDIEYRYEPLA